MGLEGFILFEGNNITEGQKCKSKEGFKDNQIVINGKEIDPHNFMGLSVGWGIGTVINICITILALYFYFKCNWSKKGKFSTNVSSISDKILGFLVSCCCSICYVAYHLAIPC